MPDDFEERKKLFAELKAEISKRQLSNTENFDKAVLAYSTAGLGFSLGFLKDFVKISTAVRGELLYWSWALFVASIVLTICSFLISQMGLSRQLKNGERYLLEYNDDALKGKNVFAEAVDWINVISGLLFVAALMCTTLFVGSNLK
jgi:hypothetical protein